MSGNDNSYLFHKSCILKICGDPWWGLLFGWRYLSGYQKKLLPTNPLHHPDLFTHLLNQCWKAHQWAESLWFLKFCTGDILFTFLSPWIFATKSFLSLVILSFTHSIDIWALALCPKPWQGLEGLWTPQWIRIMFSLLSRSFLSAFSILAHVPGF